MDKPDLYLQKEISKLNEILKVCEKVAATVKTEGWKDIIEPLIDKSIADIVGAKNEKGRWYGGLLDKARKDEKREYYIGYKQALIDLHRRVYAYPDSIKNYEKQREDLLIKESARSTIPLVDDTKYGRTLSEGL